MKLLTRLIIAFTVCLITIPVISLPARADEPEIWLSDSSGYVGDEIRLYGEDLSDHSGTVWVYYEVNDNWEMVDKDRVSSGGSLETNYFFIPESTKGAHEIRVCDNDDEDDWLIRTEFSVEPQLEITSPANAEGPVGTEVTVKGTGFAEDEDDIELRYYLHGSDYERVGKNIEADEYGTWEAKFSVPTSGSGSHDIDARGDDSSFSEVKDASFEVKPGINLSKSSGYVGDRVTVNGSGFKKKETSVKVTYDGKHIGSSTTAGDDGNWEISFDVPPSAAGEHKIDAYGRSTTAANIDDKNFTVNSKATLAPTNGHVGINLNASGTGFTANKPVSIKYDAVQITTTENDSKGSFSVSFSAPESKYGEHTITMVDASGNTVDVKFTMESTPPARPRLTSPVDDSRIGLVGSQTPIFTWSAVSDASGVSYIFQVASDPGFVNLVAPEIDDLTKPSYTLSEGQALPYGNYYWRVKAIDGAQNDSGWTATSSFQVGLMPLWALIVIVVIVVAFIGALLFLLAIKK